MNLAVEHRIGFGRRTDFIVLAASWFTFGLLFETVKSPPLIFIVWVLITTGFLIISLNAIGYFERFTPQPELSGVLSLLLTLPVCAFSARWIVAKVGHAELLPYHEVLRASVWVAMVFELNQWIVYAGHRTRGRQWVLATCLHPSELRELREQLEQSGSSSWIKVHPINITPTESAELSGHETLVISRRAVHDLKNHPEFLMAHLRGQPIVDIHQLLKEFRCRVDLKNADAWTFFLGAIPQGFLIRLYFGLKTFFEPLAALALLVLLSPFLAALVIVLYITDGRPILYRQERLGYGGKTFNLYKFRTMTNSAEKEGPRWASKDDPRVTSIGRFLRRTRLDELPQLLNVLKGELSFVGPRPERPEFYEILNEQIPLFSLRLLVRPGITGWAQVMQGYVSTIEGCKTKLEYDLYYVQNMSPQLDLRALVNTMALMLRGNSGQ